METNIATFLEYWSSQGHELFFCCPSDSKINSIRKFVKGFLFVDNFQDNGSQTFREIITKLENYIKEHEIIHVLIQPLNSFLPSALACLKSKVPFSTFIHGPYSTGINNSISYQRLIHRFVFQNSTNIFCVSQESKNLLRNYNNTVLLPNPINSIKKISRNASKSNKKIATIISRLDFDKEPSIINAIELIQGLIKLGYSIRIVGDGEAKTNIERSLRKVGSVSNKVEFMGSVSDTSEFIIESDIVMGMGRVILEASIFGKPTILLGYDGIKGLITIDNLKYFITSNFSGRGYENVGVERILKVISDDKLKSYSQEISELIKKTFDVSNLGDLIINKVEGVKLINDPLAHELINQINSTDIDNLYNSQIIDDLIMDTIKINSKEYWDLRFRADWKSKFGQEQTRFFGKVLCENIPNELLKDLNFKGVEICDMGCAEGEATDLIQCLLPNATVSGYDFSEDAINKAIEKFPKIKFIPQGIDELSGKFDAIICSNTLEHFVNPLNKIRRLLKNTKKYLILMFPFKEIVQIPEHSFQFDYSKLPLEIDTAKLIFSKEIDTSILPESYWKGRQMLVIYKIGEIKSLFLTDFTSGLEEIEKKATTANLNLLEDVKRLTAEQIEQQGIFERSNKLNEKLVMLYRTQLESLVASREYKLFNASLPLFNRFRIELIYKFLRGIKRHTIDAISKKISKVILTRKERRLTNYVLAEMESTQTGKLVIVFQNIPWNFRWQRLQHLATQFANAGYQLLIVNFGFKNEAPQLRILGKQIFELQLQLPIQHDLYKEQLGKEEVQHLTKQVLKSISKLNTTELIYFNNFPGWHNLLVNLKKQRKGYEIFDLIDDNSSFENNGKYISKFEADSLKSADLVIATSNLLLQYAKEFNKNTLLLRNAAATSFLNPKSNGILKDLKHPIIGYIGAITEWVDLELIKRCVIARPEWSFVLIGRPDVELGILKVADNVKIIGEVPFSKLPGYLADFDLALIPFKDIPLIKATNPIKMYEYLAAGKKVLSFDNEETRLILGESGVYSDYDGFVKKAEHLLNNKVEYQFDIKVETWENRFKILLKRIIDGRGN